MNTHDYLPDWWLPAGEKAIKTIYKPFGGFVGG